MPGCPFHAGSSEVRENGEILSISCIVCGDYRISETAVERVRERSEMPGGWIALVHRRPLISTRDLAFG